MQQQDDVAIVKYNTVIFERLTIAVGIISAICSLSVCLTGLIFYEKMMKGKIFFQILMMAAFCDLIGTGSTAVGMLIYSLFFSLCSS